MADRSEKMLRSAAFQALSPAANFLLAVIEQRSVDVTIRALRGCLHQAPALASVSRSEADAAHVRAKARMLQIKIIQHQRRLVLHEDVNELLDAMVGVVLTHLSGLPTWCSRNLTVRRDVERTVFEVRTELAQACEKMADERGEPPLDQHSIAAGSAP